MTIQVIKSIEECISTPYEIIIIDDNSDKETKDKMQKLVENNHKIRILSYDYSIGVNQAWNLGVEESKWEYILIINNDILLTPWIDIKLIKAFEDPNIKVSCPVSTRGNYARQLPKFIKTDNICWWCYMVKKENNMFPIDDRLDIWYGDNWIYNMAGKEWVVHIKNTLIHHFESKTLKTKEQAEALWNRIEWDKLNREKILQEKWWDNIESLYVNAV